MVNWRRFHLYLVLCILWEHHVDTILVRTNLSIYYFQWHSFSCSFLQLLFLRRAIYPCLSSDPSPLVFIQHPMVSHDKRSSKVEYLQGDPEDCEKVLVPYVDVHYYYCWDGYSFNFTCTILVASEWIWLGFDFSLVVSGIFWKLYCVQVALWIFFSLLGYPFHVIFCSRFVLYPKVIYVVSYFLRPTDCVEPMAYGFLVLIDFLGPDIDLDLFFITFTSDAC